MPNSRLLTPHHQPLTLFRRTLVPLIPPFSPSCCLITIKTLLKYPAIIKPRKYMKWGYEILATSKIHFSNIKTNRINNKIVFGMNLKVENKCLLAGRLDRYPIPHIQDFTQCLAGVESFFKNRLSKGILPDTGRTVRRA